MKLSFRLSILLLLSGCAAKDIDVKLPLLMLFSVLALMFFAYWMWNLRSQHPQPGTRNYPNPVELLIGAVTNFFDTLGIGSFAPTTAFFRMGRIVPDELLPGTLNVGQTLPTITQALIFIQLVPVATDTLLPMIFSAGIGAWLGAGVAGRLPRFQIRLGMGLALLLAATIMLLSLLKVLPAGEDALGLVGWKWWFGVAGNFALGLLMPLGIGLYAPCMIMVSLLGMSPLAAFPIMMGSCAFLMPISSMRFCQNKKYSASAALGLAIGGVSAVLLAAFLVKSLPLDSVRWVVVAVVIIVAASLLSAAFKEKR
jgi:uncharacterized membrane protein YfcA